MDYLHKEIFLGDEFPIFHDFDDLMKEENCDVTLAHSSGPSIFDKHLLPPCRVCKGNASGFHYGVNTCNACKGFFRRTLLRGGQQNKCLDNDNCNITFSRRRCCPSCRYNKCLAVGMSKNAIKTGRYTHKKRTQDTLEIMMLKEGKHPQHLQEDSRVSNYNLPAHATSPENDSKRLMNHLQASHGKYVKTALSDSSMEHIEKDQQVYYEQYSLKIAMFGSLSPLPKEQYDEIYQTTGIDIDNRQDMMKMLAATMEMDIRRYINFVKSGPRIQDAIYGGSGKSYQKELFYHIMVWVPCYIVSPTNHDSLVPTTARRFHRNDSYNDACFEFYFLGSFRGYNNKTKILSTSSGKCLHIQEVCKIWDKDFVLALFNFSDSLKSLNLSEEECVLIKTMVVFFRDRCELQNPEQVESIQWTVICALRQLLAKTHCRPNLRFAKIMDRLAEMRSFTEWNNKIVKSLSQWSAVRERSLLLEILVK